MENTFKTNMQQLSLGITIESYSQYYINIINDIKVKKDNIKIQFANQVLVSDKDISFLQFAKHINKDSFTIGRNTLYRLLRRHRVLMSNNLPYQSYIDRKYFTTCENVVWNGYSYINIPQTFITPKGQLWLVNKIKEWE